MSSISNVLKTVAALGALASVGAFAEDAPSQAPSQRPLQGTATLQLADGAFVTGTLQASEEPRVVRWQSPAFVRPFEFAREGLGAIQFAPPAGPSRPQGEFCFELAGGDVLFGSLERIEEGEVELEIPRLGRLRIDRKRLLSLHRLNAAELVYLGPTGLAGWREPEGGKEWKEEAGRPSTARPGGALFADLGIPPKAVIDFEVSWTGKPHFSLALAAGEDARATESPFRFDVWWRPASAASVILADARQGTPVEWEYTLVDPGDGWFEPSFKTEGWSVGPGGFGTAGTPGAIVRTEWSTPAIWLRRRFEVRGEPKGAALTVHHDEDVRVWINGRLVHERSGFRSDYTSVPLEGAAKLLRQGENTIVVQCLQRGGGQYIDVGLVDESGAAGDLVAVRETAREADLAPVQSVAAGTGRVHRIAYVDQETGRLLVFTPDGAPIASLEAAPDKPAALVGILLVNRGGDVCLERLRVSRWNGVPPGAVEVEKARVHTAGGTIAYGQLSGLDSSTKEFIVREGDAERRIAAGEVASVVLSTSVEEPPKAVRAVYLDGTQLSGDLIGLGDDHVTIASPGIQGAVRLPLSEMRSLILGADARSTSLLSPGGARSPGGVPGKLEMEGVSLPGQLMEGSEEADASCLVWRPEGSSTSSALRPGASGRITYRSRAVGGGGSAPSTRVRKSLYLRNGDAVPCEVTRIDENGLSFTTPLADATFVKHDQVKAVELVPAEGPPKLGKAKRERLLMLPRMQRPSPPTHLVRSQNGDFLRGRVIGLDDKALRVEVRAEEKQIPRDRLSHLIWLHADELPAAPVPAAAPAQAPAAAQDTPASTATRISATQVMVRQRDGNRLTFLPNRFAGTTLSGKSEVLGACRVDLEQVGEILIGAAIARETNEVDLAYHRWKLYPATDPIYIQVLDGPRAAAAPTPGTESALVGKPAPDFELDLLDGKRFRLSGSKGRVVVLDFWATWCGPCLQLMPQLDRVVRELKDPKVELIAVNLEEPAAQIASVLERHKLDLKVALDRDGVVAAKYEVASIPQTVIIDRDGKVARLFVGGGPQAAASVRDAVRDLLR